MSVDNSNSYSDESSTDPSVGGSITMDRLKQFVDEDVWYFSDGDSEDDTSSLGDTDTDPELGRVSPTDPDDGSILPTEVCFYQ